MSGQLALVDIALAFIGEVAAVIFPIAEKAVVDAVLVCTQKVALGARGTLGTVLVAQIRLFIRAVTAIVPAIASCVVRNAAAIVAGKLVVSTGVFFTGGGLIRSILAVVVPITVEAVQDAHLVQALELVRLALPHSAVEAGILVRPVQAVASAVAFPGVGDALARAVALELAVATQAHPASWRFIRAICTIGMAIAAVQEADTFAV